MAGIQAEGSHGTRTSDRADGDTAGVDGQRRVGRRAGWAALGALTAAGIAGNATARVAYAFLPTIGQRAGAVAGHGHRSAHREGIGRRYGPALRLAR